MAGERARERLGGSSLMDREVGRRPREMAESG